MAQHQDEGHGSILDTIQERASNIEAYTSKKSFDENLGDELKRFAKKERVDRESTITIRNTESIDQLFVANIIDKTWSNNGNRLPPSFWQDKLHTFVQFVDKQDKHEFLIRVRDSLSGQGLGKLQGLIGKEDQNGNNFTRREVKLEITNVKEQVKVDKINQLLKSLCCDKTFISDIKAGKLFGSEGRKQRSLMFRVNHAGFDLIFNKMRGIIPYNSTDDKTVLKFYPRINARPWSCKDCYAIGPNHQKCPGKSCTKCGSTEHLTKTCKRRTRRCTNCKRDGHRAKDSHCPIYVREVLKEIKRMDIPLDFLEDNGKRFDIIKTLIYK